MAIVDPRSALEMHSTVTSTVFMFKPEHPPKGLWIAPSKTATALAVRDLTEKTIGCSTAGMFMARIFQNSRLGLMGRLELRLWGMGVPGAVPHREVSRFEAEYLIQWDVEELVIYRFYFVYCRRCYFLYRHFFPFSLLIPSRDSSLSLCCLFLTDGTVLWNFFLLSFITPKNAPNFPY